jgi:hypothetical protein
MKEIENKKKGKGRKEEKLEKGLGEQIRPSEHFGLGPPKVKTESVCALSPTPMIGGAHLSSSSCARPGNHSLSLWLLETAGVTPPGNFSQYWPSRPCL